MQTQETWVTSLVSWAMKGIYKSKSKEVPSCFSFRSSKAIPPQPLRFLFAPFASPYSLHGRIDIHYGVASLTMEFDAPRPSTRNGFAHQEWFCRFLFLPPKKRCFTLSTVSTSWRHAHFWFRDFGGRSIVTGIDVQTLLHSIPRPRRPLRMSNIAMQLPQKRIPMRRSL